MTCREYRDLAELLRDGALDAPTAAAARAHLETCADCRAFEDESALCLAPVRELPIGPYLPPDSPWRPLPPWLGSGGAAVGVVLALLALGGAAAMGAFRSEARVRDADAPTPRETAAVETTPSPEPEPSPAPPPTAPRPALPDGRYEGRVVDEAGAPVPGAIVTVAGFPPVATDAAGLFAIPDVAPGPSRRIRIEAQGCVPLDGLAPPSWPAARTTLAAIRVGPPRSARVRVVAPDGRPAAGARVRASFVAGELYPHSRPTYRAGDGALALPAAAEAAAGDDGIATLAGLGPGPWTFTAELEGCAPSIPETGVPGSGGDGPDATVLLEAGVPLEGRVLDPEGRPLPGAEVAWLRAADRGNERDLRHEGVVRSGSGGEFRFERVPAVPLALSVRHPAGSIRVGTLDADPLLTPRVFLTAEAVATRHGLALDGNGSPAVGVVIEAQPLLFSMAGAGTERPRVLTGADGRFVLEGVPRSPPWRVDAARGGPWRAVPEDPSSFAFHPGDRPPVLLVVRLVRTGSIEGVARGADGAPAAGVEVCAFTPHPMAPQFPMRAALARSDASGRFVLDGVPAGPAIAVPGDGIVDEFGGRSAQRFAAALAEPAGSSPHRVDVPAGGRATADCPLWPDLPALEPPRAPARLRGTVVDDRGATVAGVRLFTLLGGPGTPDFFLRMPMARCRPVSADGSFDAEYAGQLPGPAGMALPVMALALAPDGRRGLGYAKVASGGVAEGVRVVLEADRPIEGRLLEPDGSPAAGALIDACPDSDPAATPMLPRAATGPDGSFRIRGLPSGAAILYVDRPGRDTVPIPVPADARMPIEIRLPGLRDLRGRVEGTDGAPAAGVFVEWRPSRSLAMPRWARSGADGSFEFRGVPGVPFRISAGSLMGEVDDGEFVQQSVVFAADEPAPRLSLERGRRVRGTAEDARGRPAAGVSIAAIFEQGGRRLLRGSRADGEGRFEVAGIPAGAQVEIEARAGTVRGAARVVEGGEDAAIRLDGELPERRGAGPLEARVLDAAGEVAERVRVRALDAETGCELVETARRTRGGFSITAPLGLVMTLEADFGGGDCVYLDGVVAGARPVVLRPGGARGALRGRVVGPDGAPAAGVAVTAFRRGPAPDGPVIVDAGDERVPRHWAGVRSARSAADGSFDLGSPRGRWMVFAGTPGTAVAPRAAVPWDAARPADVEVGTGPGWTFRLAPAAAGSHRAEVAVIRLPGFLPADAAAVELRRYAPEDGAVEIGGLPPVPVEVILRTRDGVEVRRERASPPPD